MNIVETFIIVIAALFMAAITYAYYQKDKFNDGDTKI